MSGVIPPLSHVPSWRGAWSTGTILLYYDLLSDVLSIPNKRYIISNFIVKLPLESFASVNNN